MQSTVFYDNVHLASTTMQTGKTVHIGDSTDLMVQIIGTSTNFTVAFEASLDGINFSTFEGRKVGDVTQTPITSTSDKGLYEFDVTLIKALRVNLTAIANGNISVLANGVHII